MMPGKKPASATPEQEAHDIEAVSPLTSAMAMATSPQLIMMRAIQMRAPKRWSARLLGISNRM